MPVPSSINDLSTTAGDNYPTGGESPGGSSSPDDFFRAHASFIAQLRDQIPAAVLPYLLKAGGSMTGAINESRATVAAHATACDIWGAAGNAVELTGTATITDFPDAPQAGATRRIFPAAGTVLTNNANIEVQGGADYTFAAGDWALIEALTVSTFKATVFNADRGTACPGAFKNLHLSATGTNSSVSVSYDALVLADGSGSYVTDLNASATINTATTGAGGLDTGTLAASTWYSVWRIGKPDGTFVSLFSLSANSPVMPSGYTFKARIGWFKTDSTANKFPISFIQYGRAFRFKVAPGSNLTSLPVMASGAATWPTAIAISAYAPTTAASLSVSAYAAAGQACYVAPNNAYGTFGTLSGPFVGAQAGVGGAVSVLGELLIEGANLYWGSSGGSGIVVYGWEDNL